MDTFLVFSLVSRVFMGTSLSSLPSFIQVTDLGGPSISHENDAAPFLSTVADRGKVLNCGPCGSSPGTC